MKCMNCGGICEGEYAERCGHLNASDPTTLQEQADYAQYSIDQRLKIARSIFGNGIFVGGEGAYEEVNERDIRGIYTSSSGRTYTEWIQASGTTWGSEPIPAFNNKTMASVGCPIYAAAILLSGEGIDTDPGEVLDVYTGQESTTVQKILDQYNINKTAKNVNSSSEYISKLQEGYGFATYVDGSSPFTGNHHWIVVADIRNSELGSSYGYDVYILSSTTTGISETRWHPIENVIDCLVNSGEYGTYISD